jgi:hypothetical protein
LAVAASAVAIVGLAQRVAGRSPAVSPRSAASVLYLSESVLLMRVDRRITGFHSGVLPLAAASAPLATAMGHWVDAKTIRATLIRPSRPAATPWSGSRSTAP